MIRFDVLKRHLKSNCLMIAVVIVNIYTVNKGKVRRLVHLFPTKNEKNRTVKYRLWNHLHTQTSIVEKSFSRVNLSLESIVLSKL